MYIDYKETPEADNNKYKTNDHVYKVLHTGNTSQVLSYTTTIGDGESASFTVEHNLDTNNVIVQCRNVSTGTEVVYSNVVVDENTVTITPNETLLSNQVSVCILGIK